MKPFTREISAIPIILLFVLLPFFEGGETALGLFLIHAITLGFLGYLALTKSSLVYPRFITYFSPFFLVLVISAALAPYRYAAALQLWDYFVAACFILWVCGALNRVERGVLNRFSLALFLAGSFAIIASVVLYGFESIRISASFVNPNNFACFCMMMILLGIYALEQDYGKMLKRVVGTLLLLLIVLVAFTYSRSAFIALLVVLIIHLWKRPRNRKAAAVLGGLFILTGILVFSRFVLKPQDPFRYYRLQIWKSTLRAVQENPYMGIGLNMLSHSALRFNFPADVEVGRYARVARSADSQYIQILIETGFLGLFAFLIGWIGLLLVLWKLPERYFFLKQAYTVVSIFALLSLPLNNTSILFVLCFLVTYPFVVDNSPDTILTISYGRKGRIAALVLISLLFIYGTYFPYRAHTEFTKAIQAQDARAAEEHLKTALYYNPFQPYYRFAFVKRVVDSEPKDLLPSRWLQLIQILDDSIRLNSEEPNFCVYKARCWRYLFRQLPSPAYYTNTVSSYQAAIDRDLYNPFLHVEFGAFLLFQEKNLGLAEAYIQGAIELEPAYLDARLLLVELQLRQQKLNDARMSFHELETLEQKYAGSVTPETDSYTRKLLTLNKKHKEKLSNSLQ